MRMRKKTNLVPRMEACSDYWIQNPETWKGHWRELMPQCRELRVEVGCGKGGFTVKTASADPDVLLIAVEICKDAMVVAMEKAKSMGLKNVFFISMDVAKIEEFFVYQFLRSLAPEKECQAPSDLPVLPGSVSPCPENGR